jgi:D-glycero-D-manno-heptose 1,7-bisphosphate phosphatase
MNKTCVFFDRDGIVNESPGPGYVERVADFHLIPDFIDALRLVTERGYAAVIITNQRGVGLGLMTAETLADIHDHLRQSVANAGLSLLDIFTCTATDNADPNRKPNPGMLLEAARKHGLDLSRSWMVGDNEKDVLAGQRAGCRTIRVHPEAADTAADHRVDAMAALVPLLKSIL